jgi:hypothetical protein
LNELGPLDLASLSIDIVGTVVTVALVYYGLRTLKLFKGNVAARAWAYISIGAVLIGVGVVMFMADDLQPMGLTAAGGFTQTIGTVFLVLGLRKNYLFWASKDHFA